MGNFDHSDPPSYEEFNAVSLFCPTCQAAHPVQQRLLLVLPDGELYEYRCSRCDTLVGKKKNDVPFGFTAERLVGDGDT
jgi:hypothetical protein